MPTPWDEPEDDDEPADTTCGWAVDRDRATRNKSWPWDEPDTTPETDWP